MRPARGRDPACSRSAVEAGAPGAGARQSLRGSRRGRHTLGAAGRREGRGRSLGPRPAAEGLVLLPKPPRVPRAIFAPARVSHSPSHGFSSVSRGIGGHGQGCCKGSNEIRGGKHYKLSSAVARAPTAITIRPRALLLVLCPRPAGHGPRPASTPRGSTPGTCLSCTMGLPRLCCLSSVSSNETRALWRTRVGRGKGNPVPGNETGTGSGHCLELLQGQSLWEEGGWVSAEICSRPLPREVGLALGWALGTRTLCFIYYCALVRKLMRAPGTPAWSRCFLSP